MAIQQDVSNGQLSVGYSSATFTVASMESRNSASVVIQPPSTTLSVGLGVGLGVALLLLVITAVVLCIVICTSRSRTSVWHGYFTNSQAGKHKHQNVRYSKHHQTPLQFTFTQDEMMVEGEDNEEDPAPYDDEIGGHLIGLDTDTSRARTKARPN